MDAHGICRLWLRLFCSSTSQAHVAVAVCLCRWHWWCCQVQPGGRCTRTSIPTNQVAHSPASLSTISRTATAPLERVKIIAQTEEAETTVSQLLRRIMRNEGIRGLFVGNAANTLRVFPFGGTVCLAYSQIVGVLPTKNEFHPMEPFYRGFAGAAAGAIATLVTYPLDVVKARMSVTDSQYRTIGGTIRKIVAAQGVRGLYNGLGPSVFAVAPFLAVQQSSYDVMKQLLSPYVEPSVPLFVACGAVAGMMAQTVVHPIDLVRVRMQVDAGRGKDRGAFDTARRIVARHGLQVLYNGWGAAVLKVRGRVVGVGDGRFVMLTPCDVCVGIFRWLQRWLSACWCETLCWEGCKNTITERRL